MKSVLASIKPKYCELIASGRKTVEIRKNRPKIDVPFKVYIYCTKGKDKLLDVIHKGEDWGWAEGKAEKTTFIKAPDLKSEHLHWRGKVIGEFVCDGIYNWGADDLTYGQYYASDDELNDACLTSEELWNYAKGKTLYAWHISELVIYDKPKDLDEFEKPCSHDCKNCKYWYSGSPIDYEPPCCEWEDCVITRPPQSWCYVEELEE